MDRSQFFPFLFKAKKERQTDLKIRFYALVVKDKDKTNFLKGDMFGKTVHLSSPTYSFFIRHSVKKKRNKVNEVIESVIDSCS